MATYSVLVNMPEYGGWRYYGTTTQAPDGENVIDIKIKPSWSGVGFTGVGRVIPKRSDTDSREASERVPVVYVSPVSQGEYNEHGGAEIDGKYFYPVK